MSAATDADYSQRVYSIYPENDRESPHRNANSFEHRIMDSVCEQVRRFFEIPEVVRLVAIYLQHCDHHDMETVDTEVSTEDLKFAKECLHGLPPQVDLVEGLTAEARTVGSIEVGPGAPARIELRTERFYMLCTLGAALGPADVWYRIGFIWMVIVLCREVLDLVQERVHPFDLPGLRLTIVNVGIRAGAGQGPGLDSRGRYDQPGPGQIALKYWTLCRNGHSNWRGTKPRPRLPCRRRPHDQ
ncbi:hypothetical protein DFH09DRAFT_48463 [Mycena vulgaris]|nr:hypothetical protein DFH09DRAFT_48463 [Mycena vulgaris]